MKILFLCDGNTCRSPLAEAILNKKAKEKNLSLSAESAGLGAMSGDESGAGCIYAAEALGLDLKAHRSRPFSHYMTDGSDLFVVMNNEQKKALSSYISEEKIYVLCDGVDEPCGENMESYISCAKEISRGIDELIAELSEIKISSMSEKDIDDIVILEEECFSTPWTRDGVESEFTNETARFFVAHCKGEFAGYLGMHIVLDECYIANVAVKEKFRRKGVGNALLSFGEEKAKSENCAFISLEVRVSNEKAIALYKKRGYNELGERKNFYSSPTENALIMTKDFQ